MPTSRLSRRWTTLAAASALALGSTLLVPTVAHADASGIADGVYVSTPWVEPGGRFTIYTVGSTIDCGATSFVSAAGTFELEGVGFGENYWVGRDRRFTDIDTGLEHPVGQSTPVSGQLVVKCTVGGGPVQDFTMPLTVGPGGPSSIYKSGLGWTWYSPDTGEGAVVTLNALGFTPGETVTIMLANNNQFWDAGSWSGAQAGPVTVTADGSGAVTAQVTVPAGWESSDYLDLIAAGSTSKYLLVSGTGTVLEGDPTISVGSTDSAFPGSAVSVSASGYVAGETVAIGLHSASAPAVQIGTLTANGAGEVSGIVHIPASQPTGSYRVWMGASAISYLLLNAPLEISAKPTTDRLAGSDRFRTAVEISLANFEPGVETVYLANGLNFPDALSAGALAAQLGAPVILTAPTSLPDPVREELNRLQPNRIVIVGGYPSVSAGVEAIVEGLPFEPEVVRFDGDDRFETNRMLVEDAFPDVDSVPVAYISNGLNFPDALAAAPAAASKGGIVVLVNGGASSLDSDTINLLAYLGVEDVFITGDVSSVSAGIQSQLESIYPAHVTRFAGVNRFDTASRIVGEAWPSGASSAILANGLNFPDALAAGALGVPLLTSLPTCVPDVVLVQLGDLQLTDVTLVGDPASLSTTVQNFTRC